MQTLLVLLEILILLISKVKSEWIKVAPITNNYTSTVKSFPQIVLTNNYNYTKSFTNPVIEQPPLAKPSTKPKRKHTKRKQEENEFIQKDNQFSNNTITYEGLFPILQNVQNILINSGDKPIRNKIKMLKSMRDNLLFTIQDRISKLWTPDSDLPEARGHHEHEMDFPSNEGALMTIGFLTFAVFLIKLVLKLIYALKYKAANGANGSVMTTANGATITFGRKKREIEEESLKILQYLEEYKFGSD